MLRRGGMSTRQIFERSSVPFFFDERGERCALVGGGVMLASGVMGGTDTVALVGVPILVGVVSTGATLALPALVRRTPGRHGPTWLVDMAAGVDGAGPPCSTELAPDRCGR